MITPGCAVRTGVNSAILTVPIHPAQVLRGSSHKHFHPIALGAAGDRPHHGNKWWEYACTNPVQDVETRAGFTDVDYGFSSHPVSEAQPRAFRSGRDGDGRARERVSRRPA